LPKKIYERAEFQMFPESPLLKASCNPDIIIPMATPNVILAPKARPTTKNGA